MLYTLHAAPELRRRFVDLVTAEIIVQEASDVSYERSVHVNVRPFLDEPLGGRSAVAKLKCKRPGTHGGFLWNHPLYGIKQMHFEV